MVKIATISVFPLTPWAKEKSTYRQCYFFVISTKTRQGVHQLSIRWPFSRHCFYNDTSQCALGHRSMQSAANTCVAQQLSKRLTHLQVTLSQCQVSLSLWKAAKSSQFTLKLGATLAPQILWKKHFNHIIAKISLQEVI